MDTSAKDDKAEKGQAAYIAPLSTEQNGEAATQDEIQELEHVAARLPARVWLAAAIGMAERFAYYGTQSLFRKCRSCFNSKVMQRSDFWYLNSIENYLQNSPGDIIPGAMGLGKSHATTVNLGFTVAVNLFPLPASILVDGRLGRYKALQIFTGYYWI
jgi:POT family proton-dependent oligopeptide transporter